MEILKIRTEDPQHAYDRVCEELEEIEEIALGPEATKRDIREYNMLHEQVRRKHSDGTIGHLHLNREILLFDSRLEIPVTDKKIPFRLNPGTGIVYTNEKK